ncbi:unnamed protein product [Kuraishia capsulata CBS 1993]|uniref:Mitochondrial 15S rRNA processing factor CCM1 n=1 Tax=Kuraishia capsulata CBS 1993 TaxID=1382522 RepID=W6ML71_9ASCO|nr:uncharacterized protein KUCA_T00002822001 [Kuraishia capsulata CBS 1993]CDK26848.1 unnamed protein product [Kuraishia capsulata CBS 1993]
MLRLRGIPTRNVTRTLVSQLRAFSIAPPRLNSIIADSVELEQPKVVQKPQRYQKKSFVNNYEQTPIQLLASIEKFQEVLDSEKSSGDADSTPDERFARRACSVAYPLIMGLQVHKEVGGYSPEDLCYRVASMAIEAKVARIYILNPVVFLFLKTDRPKDALSFWLEAFEYVKRSGLPISGKLSEKEQMDFDFFRMAGYLSYLRTCQKTGTKVDLETVVSILGEAAPSVERLAGIIKRWGLSEELAGYVRKVHPGVFKSLKSRTANPNDAKYWDSLKSLVLEGKFQLMEKQVQYIRTLSKETNVPLTENRLCQLMNIYSTAKRTQAAVSVFGEITKAFKKPSIASWNELLYLQSKYTDSPLDRVNSVWSLMKENQIEFDADSYANLVKAYTELDQIDEVIRVISELRNSKTVPLTNKVMESAVLALLKTNTISQAEKIMASFAANDGYVPTAKVFGLLIQKFGDAGDFAKASEVLDRMAAFEVKPDVSIYTIVINMLFKQSRKTGRPLDTASLKSLFDNMEAENISRNNYIYSTVLHDLMLQEGSIAAGETLLEYMKANKIRITATTYTSVISGFSKNGRLDDAKRYFDEAVSKGVNPNTPLFNILIEGFAKAKRLEDALSELELMKQKSVRPNFFSFYFMLKEASGAKDWDMCRKIVDQIGESGISEYGKSLPRLLRSCERNGVELPQTVVDRLGKPAV